ncbi:MAG TPA: ribosome maturation factor RimM [Gemmatimonadaceae bacterium]|nr:ribosome maturation factor RimM [Gemmatimonadaceae bacterium]
MPDSPSHVIVGRVRNVHGLKGELVIEPLTDDPDEIFTAGRRVFVGNVRGVIKGDAIEMTAARPFKGGFIVKFTGIDDRNEAELWRERYLFLPPDEIAPLEEGEVYVHELEGMRVELVSGETVGTVIATYELPQGLALDVSRAGGKSVIVPYDRVVTEVDRASRIIRIDPPEGLID